MACHLSMKLYSLNACYNRFHVAKACSCVYLGLGGEFTSTEDEINL